MKSPETSTIVKKQGCKDYFENKPKYRDIRAKGRFSMADLYIDMACAVSQCCKAPVDFSITLDKPQCFKCHKDLNDADYSVDTAQWPEYDIEGVGE